MTKDKPTPARSSRQKPGLACEECRRKKLRCDRQMPCGGCVEFRLPCRINEERPPRGPKKGHLKVLRSRIAALERRMTEQDGDGQFSPTTGLSPDAHDNTASIFSDVARSISLDFAETAGYGEDTLQMPLINEPDGSTIVIDTPSDSSLQHHMSAPKLEFCPESLGASSNDLIPALARADLDQLYFDRMHSFTPILQQPRYYSWAKQRGWDSASRICLRYAVWTVAAGLSTQFQSTRDTLYRDTRQMLAKLELGLDDEDYKHQNSKSSSTPSSFLEICQTWILIAMYEFTQSTFQQAWISVGRAFRYVQLMKLHEMDSVAYVRVVGVNGTESWVDMEEKRRTFWIAYCLDRICCTPNGLPLTFNEQVISTRLPSPELEFQSGTPVQTSFLSEVMAANEPMAPLSPFAEYIIFSTLWGRILCYQQQSTVEQLYGPTITEFWDRHLWLETVLAQKIQLLQQTHTPSSVFVDPMLLFINMMAQASVLSLCKVTEAIALQLTEYKDVIRQYQQKSSAAALEVAKLSRFLPQLSYFKVHPFTTIPLLVCGEFFATHTDLDQSFVSSLRRIRETLREVKGVDVFRETHLCQLVCHTA